MKKRKWSLDYFVLFCFLSCIFSMLSAEAKDRKGLDRAIEPDYLLRNEWWPEALQLPIAWGLSTGHGVTIAACDTGVYPSANDLADNLLMSYARDFSNPEDQSVSNGNYVSQGTATAGIIAGVKNFQGINGIAYNSRLIPLQNYHYSNLDRLSLEIATARCIKYAITIERVSIIIVQAILPNTGSIETSSIVRDAVSQAIKSGVTVIVPAGDSTKELSVERTYDSGSIIVGAATKSNSAAIFSNYGARVSISAYGENIKSLWGQYGETSFYGGTLAASAQIAGITALAKEVNKDLLPNNIKWLFKTTRQRSTSNYNVGGVVDTLKFLEEAKKLNVNPNDIKQAKSFREAATLEIKKEPWAQ